ncbi:hypothetical protein V6N13_005704 [Hibiscus sabdariffa]
MASIPGHQSVSTETDGSNPDFSDSNQPQNQTHSKTNETQCSMPPSSKKAKKGVGNKRRSWVWDHFNKSESLGENIAICSYCDKQIACASYNGTSSLSNHLLRCKKYPPNVDKSQKILSFQPGYTHLDGTIQTPKLENWKFDHDACRKALAKMVIVDELAFKFVEREVIEKPFDEDIASELRDRISHALSSMFASYVVVFDAK